MPFQRHNVCMTGFARHLLPADWRLLTARESVSGRGGWRWRNARVGLGLVDKPGCDFAKSRKQRRGSDDTWHAGLSLIHDEDRRSGRLRLDTFKKKNLSAPWHASVIAAAAAWAYSLSRLYSSKCVCVWVSECVRAAEGVVLRPWCAALSFR